MTDATADALTDRGIHIVRTEHERFQYSVEREWFGEFYEIAAVFDAEEARVAADAWMCAGNPGPHSWRKGSQEADAAVESALGNHRAKTTCA